MKVHLYLMRHCEPFPGPPMDGTRKLTKEGQRQAREMVDFLVRQIGRVDITITSPFIRAMETATVMAEALGSHIADTKLLEPDATPEEAWKEIERLAQDSKHVLVVGHDPSINSLLAWLITGGDIRFEHGAIALVKIKKRDGLTPQVIGKLHWLVDVSLIEKDEDEAEVVEAARELANLLS